MNPKVLAQLVKAIKSFVATIAVLFGKEGVRIIGKLVDEWLEARAKKAKTTKKRARRKKS